MEEKENYYLLWIAILFVMIFLLDIYINNIKKKVIDISIKYNTEIMEKETGKKAIINYMPIQPGEVVKSEADNSALYETFDFKPKTNVEEGVHKFVKWYREYYGI